MQVHFLCKRSGLEYHGNRKCNGSFFPVFYFQFTCPPCNSRRAKQQAAAKKHESFDVGGAAGGGLMVPQQQVRRHSTGNPAAESAAVAAAAEAFKKKRGSAADIRQQQAAAAAGQQQQKQQQQQGGGASSRGAFMKRVNQVNRARLVPLTCKNSDMPMFSSVCRRQPWLPRPPARQGVRAHPQRVPARVSAPRRTPLVRVRRPGWGDQPERGARRRGREGQGRKGGDERERGQPGKYTTSRCVELVLHG